MQLKRFVKVAICAVLILPSVLAVAQDLTIKEFLTGGKLPSVMKVDDLPNDYRAVKIKTAGGGGGDLFGSMFSGIFGMFGLMGGMMGGMSGGAPGGEPGGAEATPQQGMELFMMLDTSWTRGDTVKMGAHEYVVTYKLEMGMRKAAMTSQASNTPPIGVSLRLTLVRTDMIATAQPMPELTKEQLKKAIGDAGIPEDKEVVALEGEAPMLAAILFPVFAQAKEAAKETVALSNAKQIATAALIYSSDYDDLFPAANSSDEFKKNVMPYLKNEEVFKTGNPNGSRFLYNVKLSGVFAGVVDDPGQTILVYESAPWPDGKRTVAFADGSAKRVSTEEWKKLEPSLKKSYPRPKPRLRP